ncbi:MAG: hypothetical protein HQK84_07430 [Nitrospinae bacterium]|nr:hypothetical protein [Nitrospinota bacterium]
MNQHQGVLLTKNGEGILSTPTGNPIHHQSQTVNHAIANACGPVMGACRVNNCDVIHEWHPDSSFNINGDHITVGVPGHGVCHIYQATGTGGCNITSCSAGGIISWYR